VTDMTDMTDMTDIRPFAIHVPDEVLVDLRERLARARLPDQIPDTGWALGTERRELAELCTYWLHSYDWRAAEAALNRWSHRLTDIDGQRIHFVHQRSSRPDATPLLLMHGWPGSIVEFEQIVEDLVEPADEAQAAFHVVLPSLPGFAWSAPTTSLGWDVRRMADAMAVLMSRLGYDRYLVQGGDVGAIVGTQLGMRHGARLLGLHLNLVVVGPPDPADPLAGLDDAERELVGRMQPWQQWETGYSWIQGTKPQTLAYALTDSPTGLAAWILEKFRGWSDCDGDVWTRFTRDQLLTNIMLYWVTGSIGSSTRLYYESRRSGVVTGFRGYVDVPTAVAVFPAEPMRFPRPWVEACYQVRRWTEMPAGGHFAALEEPRLLVEDIRGFHRSLSPRTR
jgi:pimeloyl-ACP methyl ester carboxylesterase